MKRSEVTQPCLNLCVPMDCSLPGSSIHGIFQARIWEWVAISFSRRSSWPRDWTQVSCIEGICFTIWATREFDSLLNSKLLSKVLIWDCTFFQMSLEKTLRNMKSDNSNSYISYTHTHTHTPYFLILICVKKKQVIFRLMFIQYYLLSTAWINKDNFWPYRDTNLLEGKEKTKAKK